VAIPSSRAGIPAEVIDVAVKRRWSDLSQGRRRLIVATAAVDGALRIAALIDLWRRPAGQIRGSKKAWAACVALINSAGVLPISYFVFGRRRVA
jgi:Family of unknown function (DUF5652)